MYDCCPSVTQPSIPGNYCARDFVVDIFLQVLYAVVILLVSYRVNHRIRLQVLVKVSSITSYNTPYNKPCDYEIMLSDFQELIFSAKLGDKVKEVQEIHENFKFTYGYTDSYGET